MEIIKKNSIGYAAKFKVLRSFYFRSELKEGDIGKKPLGPVMLRVGDEIEIIDRLLQVGLCKSGRVFPILPPVAVYIALRPIVLGGKTEKFECKAMELIELKAADAVDLLLSGAVLPQDDSVWRPFGKSLKQKTQGMTQKQIDAYEAERFKQKNWEIGILQKGKSK